MASSPAPTRQTLLAHMSFFVVVAIVPIALTATTGVAGPAARWFLVYAPFWLWLAIAVRQSPRPVRWALLAWTAASIAAAALAGPQADLTVVPRVVWIVGEIGLVFHFLGQVLVDHGNTASAALSEVLAHVAVVTAVTTGVTWFLARGSYEVSVRLLEHGSVRHLVHGSIGALVGVVASTALIRAWFSIHEPVRFQDGTILTA